MKLNFSKHSQKPLRKFKARCVASGLWPEIQGFAWSGSRQSLDTTPEVSSHRSRAAFTLLEMLVAFMVGSMAIGGVCTISISAAFNYQAMGHYATMDNQSRNALDVISREVRDSSQLVAFSTNNPPYLRFTNSTAGVTVTISYSSNCLYLAKSGQPTVTLLTGCDSWNFSLFGHAPLLTGGQLSFYPATNSSGYLDASLAKGVNMNWKCSRSILGSKLNTESVQTAQVVLRNKIR
jgi:hypothetical protein